MIYAKYLESYCLMQCDYYAKIFIVSEINNFAYYKASGGCARILQGNMPLSAAKIRRSKRQNEKSFVVYYRS